MFLKNIKYAFTGFFSDFSINRYFFSFYIIWMAVIANKPCYLGHFVVLLLLCVFMPVYMKTGHH